VEVPRSGGRRPGTPRRGLTGLFARVARNLRQDSAKGGVSQKATGAAPEEGKCERRATVLRLFRGMSLFSSSVRLMTKPKWPVSEDSARRPWAAATPHPSKLRLGKATRAPCLRQSPVQGMSLRHRACMLRILGYTSA